MLSFVDPNTKKFLRDYRDPLFGFPNFVRFSWQTVKTILDNKECIECEWEETEDEEQEAVDVKSLQITNFFTKQSRETAGGDGSGDHKRKMHRFFEQRSLTKVTRFE